MALHQMMGAHTNDSPSAALARYMAAATLARGADAGAAVGLVLLAVSPAAHLHHGAKVGALLAVALTAPHLLGPWVARRLDRARDGRVVLAVSFATYGLALGAAALALGRLPLIVVAAAVAVAGACGPLLTGGLSSRLAGIAGADDHSQRRAEGWDAVSYGIAGTAGPALVATLAALTTALAAVLGLAGAAVVAAIVTLTLPRESRKRESTEDTPRVRETLRLMVANGPLRRVSVATVLTAFSFGPLASVIAVVFASELASGPGAGATLAAGFGLGNLAGSLLVTAFPLRGEPETLTTRYVVLMGIALGLSALAPSYPLALAAFVLAGASNAPFFTATLAARSRYSPEQARAQVFVTLGGTKVAMSSLGTAAAGAAIGLGARGLLAAGAAVTLAGAASNVLDRRLSSRSPRQPPPRGALRPANRDR
jgi:MFS family permease